MIHFYGMVEDCELKGGWVSWAILEVMTRTLGEVARVCYGHVFSTSTTKAIIARKLGNMAQRAFGTRLLQLQAEKRSERARSNYSFIIRFTRSFCLRVGGCVLQDLLQLITPRLDTLLSIQRDCQRLGTHPLRRPNIPPTTRRRYSRLR